MLKPQKDKPYSYFQQTSSVFSFSIIIQAIVLILSFFVILIDKIDPINYLNIFWYFTIFFHACANLLFPILLFLSIYALVLIPYIVLQVFIFWSNAPCVPSYAKVSRFRN